MKTHLKSILDALEIAHAKGRQTPFSVTRGPVTLYIADHTELILNIDALRRQAAEESKAAVLGASMVTR